jgi:hypothetical protein
MYEFLETVFPPTYINIEIVLDRFARNRNSSSRPHKRESVCGVY